MSLFVIFIIVAFIIIALANVSLGFFVLLRNHDNKIRITFFAASLIQGLFAFSYAAIPLFPAQQLFWLRFTWIGAVALAFFLLFFHYFLHSKVNIGKILLIFLPLLAIFFISIFTDLMLISYKQVSDLNFEFQPGKLAIIGRLLTLIYLIVYLWYLIKGYRQSEYRQRLQIKYFLWGFSIYLLAGVVLASILPIIKPQLTSIAAYITPVFSLIWVGFTAYSIVRFRLFDITTIIHKTIAWFLFSAIVIMPCTLFYYLIEVFSIFLNLNKWLVLILYFSLTQIAYFIYSYVKPQLDQIFQRKKYESMQVIKEFSQSLYALFSTAELLEMIAKKINEIFYSSNVSIFLLAENKKKYILAYTLKKNKPVKFSLDDSLIQLMQKNKKILEKDLDVVFTENWNELNAESIIPLIRRNRMLGFIILARKENLKIYSDLDLELLEHLSKNSSIAIENSIVYSEQIIIERREKELEKVKSEFLSIFAHQMRTPLSEVRWAHAMLLDGDFGSLNTKQQEIINRGSKANAKVITLVNNLLQLAELEKNKIPYFFKPELIDEIIQEVISDVAFLADNKKITIKYDAGTAKFQKILLDQTKIKIALSNIIENAIKYSLPGNGINIYLEITKKNLIVNVSDNGIGINDEEKKELFVKFFRGEQAMKLETEGSGLGLYFAQKIIKVHGGSIAINSQLGKGTMVKINLPIQNEHKR